MVADFTGGPHSTDGCVLLLRQVDQALGVSRLLADCFHGQRDTRWVDHSVPQRLYDLALGYEDLNDHSRLRDDPLLAGRAKKPIRSEDRFLPQFRDAPQREASSPASAIRTPESIASMKPACEGYRNPAG